MNIKNILAFDLDGTIIDSQHRISNQNIEALQKAIAAGCLVIPATGRSHQAIPREIMNIPGLQYAISCNGSYVKDLHTDEVVFCRNIPIADAKQILRDLESYHCVPEIGIDSHILVEEKHVPAELNYFRELGISEDIDLINFIRKTTPDIYREMECFPDLVTKIIVILLNKEDMLSCEKNLLSKYSISICDGLPQQLEITSRHVSKKTALEHIAEMLGIERKNTFAIGDSGNDIEMLRWAGTGIAMENAGEHVKAAADFITGSHDEDGFAKAIEQFLLT